MFRYRLGAIDCSIEVDTLITGGLEMGNMLGRFYSTIVTRDLWPVSSSWFCSRKRCLMKATYRVAECRQTSYVYKPLSCSPSRSFMISNYLATSNSSGERIYNQRRVRRNQSHQENPAASEFGSFIIEYRSSPD